MSLTNGMVYEQRSLGGRFSEDEFYDMVKEFLTEGSSPTTVYVADRDGQMLLIDPNSGQALSDDISGWDERQMASFFRSNGISSLVVRDRAGSVGPGEYSAKAFIRKVGAPKRAQTFKVVQGEPVSGPSDQASPVRQRSSVTQSMRPERRAEALVLQNALLDNDWPSVG